jgi:hypothetical protein
VGPDSVTGYFSLTPETHFLEVSSADNNVVYDVVEADLSSLEGSALAAVVVPVEGETGPSATIAFSGITGPLSMEDLRIQGTVMVSVYPNPSAGPVRFDYRLEEDGCAELSIYTLSGQKIRTLVHGELSAGKHSARWDGRSDEGIPVSPGTYLYVCRTGQGVYTGKLSRSR